MDDTEYLEASRQFLTSDFHPEKITPQEMDSMLRAVKVVTVWCDTVKRGLYYGKDITLRSSRGAHTSVKLDPKHAQLIHGIIGLFGEAGELMGHLHDVLTGGSEVDPVNILEELGDMEWYAAVLHRLYSTTPRQARTVNIAKLDKRYPGRRFTEERALERDLNAERETLEAAAAMDHPVDRPQPASELKLPEPPTPVAPAICSRWRHTNGNCYTVLLIANEMNTDQYPLTVVYRDDNGKIWTRRVDDWYRNISMTLESYSELSVPA